MELIHRYDNEEDKWFNELYDEGVLIRKEEAEKEPEYDLFETIQLQDVKYIVTDISRSLYSANRLVIEVEKYQDYLDKSTLVKSEDGEYLTVKEQKELRAIELTGYQQQIMNEIKNDGVHKERVRGSFQKLVKLHDNLLKRLKD
ncbi:hypothetical protein [Priestia aryabhattai]|uniref:hypothetical protein n=1 Tax=Priestia aryabhattai TaxID=412384 RepID=UPI0015F52841|nr:hypothetical protein [Priestia aryabhattai]